MTPPQTTDAAAEQDAASKTAPVPAGQLWIAAFIALVAIVVRAWMSWSTHSTTEDFYITLRYSENIAHGVGFIYNHGERVLGTTTPLYTLLLALSAWLHVNPIIFGKLLNIVADGGTCFLMAYLPARAEIGCPRAGQFAALLYAFSSTPISITIGGMETGLVTCVCMAMVLAYVARSTRALYLLGAVLFLLRIDGLLLFGLLAVSLAIRQRRIPWGDLFLSILVALPWIAFAYGYFGSPIPTSLTAKLYVYSHAMATPRSVTLEAFRTQFLGGITQMALSLFFAVGVVGIVLRAVWTPGSWTLHKPHVDSLETADHSPGKQSIGASLAAPALWLCVYYLAMFLSRVPPFPWYFLPPWPVYLIVAILGVRITLGWIPAGAARAFKRIENPAVCGTLALLGLYGVAHLRQIRTAIAQDQFVEDTLREPLGLWFKDHALPGERILLEPIGYVGYFSQRPILDMIGLVSPEVFRSYRTPDPLADMVARFRPEWLCIRPAEMRSIQRGDSKILESDYDYVREFHVPGRLPDFLIYHLRKGRVYSR